MADLVTLTFKVPPEQENLILLAMGRHDVTRTLLIRKGLDMLLPFAEVCPAILSADEKRIAEAMRAVGKMFVSLGYF
ncbi:hypothetical protein [Desulfovibrio sp.]|uniref:hypothetical protein n=1 Tax=Desulfovibrio sp. TaxID=885 RepID=UPI0023C643EB|nr:hypothetical protein [Desulfovibrio sp.]MDE7242285.1 hypothetical protein [Desulfovibrio sp.]